MEAWAALLYANNRNVQFVCICVDPNPQVAPAFSQMFHFQNVINSHIPSRDYMPREFGQLGCSGFIITDCNVCFISRRTKSYLQIGDLAFRDVEKILAQFHVHPTTQLPRIQIPVAADVSESQPYGSNVEQSNGIKRIKQPTSVGVARMDTEHEECTNAFNALLQTPSFSNLQAVLRVLTEHFDHEEQLLKKFKFGRHDEHDESSTKQFSSLASHISDHQRILNIGRSEQETMKQQMVTTEKDEVDC